MKLESITQLHFEKNYAAKSIPFVLKSSGPKKSKKEILKVIEDEWGEEPVELRSSLLTTPTLYLQRTLETSTWGGYLKNYRKPEFSIYAANNPVRQGLHQSVNLKYPAFYPQAFFNDPRIWLGPKGAVTPLHKDIPDNFAINYFGRKKWIIFSPVDFPYLYMNNPTPSTFPDLGVSEVDLRDPDFEKFPNFRKANPIEFVLDEGEMLYLPAGWGHYVENIEESLLVNFWLKREKSPAVLGCDR